MWLSRSSADQRSHSTSRRESGLRGAVVGVAAHELGGGGRRAGAGVEQGDADFAAREGAVEDGEISHDDGEEAEAGAAFENEEDARPAGCAA